ncbi:MAG: hypothetical protein EPN33_09875 [Acidobacteria bacterium]|nr:MAG: hypothetical protein EPN33_09875 [Acidobacteriota bacterium]
MKSALAIPAPRLPIATGWETIPDDLRRPILTGMRWTLWLAIAGVPFSYATRVLLARLGPACLAWYGLLLVYIAFVAGFLFLGGNAVAIRYLPLVAAGRRGAFLRSYGAIVVAAWLPWLLLALAYPEALHWLLGADAGSGFIICIMALAPVPILFSLLLAALKGSLDLAWAQGLYRGVTVGTFAGVLVLFLTARSWFAFHAAALIWGIYFALMAAGCALAWVRWRGVAAPRPQTRTRYFLPRGFWNYTLGLQGSSMLGFFATQLDMLFVLHAGGLRRLGAYVAVMGLATLAAAALKLLLDAFMAALSHGVARGDAALTGDLFVHSSRLLLLLILALNAALTCWAVPLLAVYGPAYAGLQSALRWLGPCAAIAGLNYLLGSALSALGHPRAEVVAKVVRIAAFVALFWPLWQAWGLTGAVLAWGGAELPYQALNLFYLRRLAPFPLRWRRLYPAFLAALALLVVVASWGQPQSFAAGLGAWTLVMAVFLMAAGYSRSELGSHLRIFLPGMAAAGGL